MSCHVSGNGRRAHGRLWGGVNDSSADVGQQGTAERLQDATKGDPACVGEGVKHQSPTVARCNQLILRQIRNTSLSSTLGQDRSADNPQSCYAASVSGGCRNLSGPHSKQHTSRCISFLMRPPVICSAIDVESSLKTGYRTCREEECTGGQAIDTLSTLVPCAC